MQNRRVGCVIVQKNIAFVVLVDSCAKSFEKMLYIFLSWTDFTMYAEQSLMLWDGNHTETAQPTPHGCLLIIVLLSALVLAIVLLVLYGAMRTPTPSPLALSTAVTTVID